MGLSLKREKKNMEDEVVKKNQKFITNKIYCNQKNEN
jgi:hypothetical protein